MRRAMQLALVAMLATQALVIGQSDVGKVLADVRKALGGEEKLSGVRTVSIEGTSSRVAPDGSSRESPFEIAFELPDKYVKRDVAGNLNGMEIARLSGFNGSEPIERTDTPPQMGGARFIMRGPGGAVGSGETPTPEQKAASLRASRRDFVRYTLGMFATAFPSYPVEFGYAGEAESPDGRAQVLDVKNEDGFAARLFVDAQSHLPLMLSWMDKEPLQMTAGGGNGPQMRMIGPGGMSREDLAKMQEEMEARMKEAEAKRRTVEFRLFYADYKAFDGVRLPTRVQRMVDGNPVEELQFKKVRINDRIDPKKFEVSK